MILDYGSDLKRAWQGKCAVTGISTPELLRASHIVGWCDDESQRLNPNNGLLLSAHIDALFDKHLISFDDGGRLLVRELDADTKSELKLEGRSLPLDKLSCQTLAFLKKHRERFIELGGQLTPKAE